MTDDVEILVQTARARLVELKKEVEALVIWRRFKNEKEAEERAVQKLRLAIDQLRRLLKDFPPLLAARRSALEMLTEIEQLERTISTIQDALILGSAA